MVGCAHTMRDLYLRKTDYFDGGKTKVFTDYVVLACICFVWNMRLKLPLRRGMKMFCGECVSPTELGF